MFENISKLWAGKVAEVVECLPRKLEALSLNPSTINQSINQSMQKRQISNLEEFQIHVATLPFWNMEGGGASGEKS
jgi:hypothetical protein